MAGRGPRQLEAQGGGEDGAAGGAACAKSRLPAQRSRRLRPSARFQRAGCGQTQAAVRCALTAENRDKTIKYTKLVCRTSLNGIPSYVNSPSQSEGKCRRKAKLA